MSSNPFIQFTPDKKEELLNLLRTIITLIEVLPTRRSCDLCDRYKSSDQWCDQWGDNVPVHVQRVGSSSPVS